MTRIGAIFVWGVILGGIIVFFLKKAFHRWQLRKQNQIRVRVESEAQHKVLSSTNTEALLEELSKREDLTVNRKEQ